MDKDCGTKCEVEGWKEVDGGRTGCMQGGRGEV